MRRILITLTIALTALATGSAALATSMITESVPRRDRSPVEKACAFDVVASDRLEQTATSRYADDRTLLVRTITGKQLTVFEQTNGAAIEIETVGSTSITRNADGSYTLVQRGSGFWFDDGNLSGSAELVRFTGTVRATGTYDGATFTFQPITRAIEGVTSSICDMLVTGLKTRH